MPNNINYPNIEKDTNTLRVCEESNNMIEISRMKKTKLKTVVYKCVECGYKHKITPDLNMHKRASHVCRACCVKNYNEKKLYVEMVSFLRTRGIMDYYNIFKAQYGIDGTRKRFDFYVGGRFNCIIELDDPSHLYNRKTKESDDFKMNWARLNGYRVIRVFLDNNEELDSLVFNEIWRQLRYFERNRMTGFKLVVLNDVDGKLTNRMNEIIN